MEIVIKLAQFLLSLSLLIILHELGHFIPAKLFKTRVEKFYLFFDVKFSLVKKKIGETVYGIGWLPLGGYVKIAGMIDESMDTEQMALPPQPWEFRSKPAWQRLIIMLGGVTVNFVLAFVIHIGMAFAYGEMYLNNSELKDGIAVSPVGEQIGFRDGDKIISLDGEKYERFNDIPGKLIYAKKVLVERDGTQKEVAMPVDLFDKLLKGEKQSLISFRAPMVVGTVPDTSANINILKSKDVMLSLAGSQTKYFDQVKPILQAHKNETIDAVVLRDQKEVPLKLKVMPKGNLGIEVGTMDAPSMEKLGIYKFGRVQYGFFESIPVGFDRGWEQIKGYGQQLKAIFTPKTGAYKGVGGFMAIFNIFPNTWSWEAFWGITAFLSIMLGVLNLLPIPALDGGHVMFLLYEMISGKKPSDKFMERAQTVGFLILIALVLFANGNDFFRKFIK